MASVVEGVLSVGHRVHPFLLDWSLRTHSQGGGGEALHRRRTWMVQTDGQRSIKAITHNKCIYLNLSRPFQFIEQTMNT